MKRLFFYFLFNLVLITSVFATEHVVLGSESNKLSKSYSTLERTEDYIPKNLFEFQVNTYTSSEQGYSASAKLAGGGFVIVWQSDGQDGSSYGIYGQRYASDGTTVGSEFRINSYTTKEQSYPSVAGLTGGGFVVTWSSNSQDDDYYEIYGQRYTSDGSTAGGEFRVNTNTIDDQYRPSVAGLTDGGFVIAWGFARHAVNYCAIYAQRYTSNGSKVGDEFIVKGINYHTETYLEYPSIAGLTNGGFVVTWAADSRDGNNYGIYGQLYASNGSATGSTFHVNTYITNRQSTTSVAGLTDGKFVVVWESLGQDGDGYGIYGQVYASNGATVGNEFRINTYTVNSQINTSIVGLTDGKFVIVWQSDGQDGSSYGIYGQVYASDGTTVGYEFKINTYTANDQQNPSVAGLTDGKFVVTWSSYGQDGNGDGIYAGIFDSSIGQNAAPIFTSIPVTSATENQVYTYNITATDVDGDNLIIVASTLPSWLTFTDNGDGTAVLTGTPTNSNVGTNTVALVVYDGIPKKSRATNTQSFNIEVADVNNAPTFTSTPVTDGNEDEVYTYNITTHDVDEDNLVISSTTIPNWLTLTDNGNGTAVLTGTPTNAYVGSNPVVLVVDDGASKTTDTQSFNIEISNVNDAPVFTSTPVLIGSVGEVYTYNITAHDDDGDNLTIYLLAASGWVNLTDNGDGTAVLTGTPTSSYIGSNHIKLSVSDGVGKVTNTQNFYIEVSNANHAPTFTSTAITSATENETYTYNITASDDDGDNLAISSTTLPSWLTLTDNGDGTAVLTGTPLTANIGSNSVVLVVNDGVSKKSRATDTQSFNIEVSNANHAPTFTSTAITSATENEVYTYNITASDNDGDNLVISSTTLPSWLTLTDNGDGTAVLTGTPLSANVGSNSVVLVVNDGVSKKLRATDTQSFNIEVAAYIPMAPPGNALEFDGVNDGISFDANFTSASDNWTMSVWFNPTVFVDEEQVIFYNGDDSGGYGIAIYGNEMRVLYGAAHWLAGITTLPKANCWYHFAMKRENGTLKTFLNGKQLAYTSNFNLYVPYNKASIGMHYQGDHVTKFRFFKGKIDEAELFDKVLTDAEIRGNMKKALNGDENHLVAYYKFDKNSGNVLIDKTINANNGTLYNMTDEDWVASNAMIYAPTATEGTDITSDSFTANWEEDYTADKYYIDVASDSNFNAIVAGYDNLEVNGTNSKNVTGLAFGTYYYRVRAYNAVTTQTSENSNIVSVTLINTAPSFTSTPDTTAVEGEVYAYNITTNDSDGNNLTITATTLPSWLSLTDNGNGTAFLSGTPANANIGSNPVVLVVNDGISKAIDTQSFNVEVASYIPMTPPGNALEFDGNNDYITANDVAENFSVFTMETWFKNKGGFSNRNSILAFNSVSGNRYEIGIYTDAKIYIYSPSSDYTKGPVIEDDKWYHVAVTHDNNTDITKMYVNGEEVASTTSSDEIISEDRFSIGQEYDGVNPSDFFEGEIDEVRVWRSIRTQEEIQENMKKTLNGNEDHLVAYYKFDKSSGNVLVDRSSNSNNGTLKNMTDEDWVSSNAMIYAPKATAETEVHGTSFVANWEEDYTADKYYLDVATDNGFSSMLNGYDNLEVNGATFKVVIGLVDGTYYYRVRAYNAFTSQTSENSNVISVTIANIAPEITAFTPVETEITLTTTSTLSFSITAEDANNDSLSYSWIIDDIVQVDSVLTTFTHSFENNANPYTVKAIVSDGELADTTSWSVTASSGIEDNLPLVTKLSQNYPNPFNPVTTINYSLVKDDNVRIVVYNSVGKVVANLVNSTKKAGYHSVQWNGSNITSGIYFIRMTAGDYSKNIKAILVK